MRYDRALANGWPIATGMMTETPRNGTPLRKTHPLGAREASYEEL
jgi:hypothetical protein